MVDGYGSLTPELQLDALASLGIYPMTGLCALNSYENRVSVFTDENNLRFVVKFYRPQRWSDEQLQEEHDLCHSLKKHHCAISAPIMRDGQSIFHFAGFRFALFESLSARTMDIDNIDFLYDLGSVIGTMHNISSQTVLKKRVKLDVQTMVTSPLTSIKKCAFIPKTIKERLFQLIDDVALQAGAILENNPYHDISLHGDCHPSNILNVDGDPYLVDFDDCKTGPAIQDLWMFLNGTREEKQLQLNMLLDGYQEQFEFNMKELTLIEALRSLRIINYVTWIAFRWYDPAFKQAFPWFSTDQYWKDLLQSLTQQIINMKASELSIYSGYNQ